MFEYKHFITGSGLLEMTLNQHGADGWRLHTCEPLAVTNGGTTLLQFVVVMDRIPVQGHADFGKPEAMAIKG